MSETDDKKKSVAGKMRRSPVKPTTKADHRLSIKHLKDSINYHKNHAKEHEAQISEDHKLIKERIKGLKKAHG